MDSLPYAPSAILDTPVEDVVKIVELEEDSQEWSLSALRQQLLSLIIAAEPGLYELLEAHLDLSEIDESETEVVFKYSVPTVEEIPARSLESFFLLHRINDVRWLNQYLIKINTTLKTGGMVVVKAETLEQYRERVRRTYRLPLACIMLAFRFAYARVMPKVPFLKKVYFLLSRGRNRVFSKAELLGRLCSCGFKILGVAENEEGFYALARKCGEPVRNQQPSYHLMIKLERLGYQGKPIFIRKFRTMHPYSEYLQEYIYQQNHLQANGKFRHDFRIASWGRLMRKYFIDELPQLINFFLGDLALVGPRALSKQYTSLYPAELLELRSRFKPGLIPPYYADLPKSFEEILASERRYLQQKDLHPVATDVKYFFKALQNIVFKRARSL